MEYDASYWDFDLEDEDHENEYVEQTKRCAVVFRYGSFEPEDSSFGYEGEDIIRIKDCKLIGNIHQNKDLLEN